MLPVKCCYFFNQLKSYGLVVVLIGLSSAATAQVAQFSEWLSNNKGRLSVRLTQYDYQYYNTVSNEGKFPIDKERQKIFFQNSEWQIETDPKKNETLDSTYDVIIKLVCLSGTLPQSSVSAAIDFSNWSVLNYVLLPAVAYNGNRYEWRKLRYSPKLYEVQDIGVDKPIILTNVPKLNETDGVSRIQERSGSLSLPAIGFRSQVEGTGFWMLTGQKNSRGDYGICIRENRDRSQAEISVTSPLVRELYTFRGCDAHFPSSDKPADFKPGDTVIFKLKLSSFHAPAIQSVFDKFCALRKKQEKQEVEPDITPYSICMDVLQKKFNEQNFVPSFGYYSVGLRENYMQDWQIGWTGGMISTYPLLYSGDKQTRDNVVRNFKWLFPNGISPSGFYWDAGKNGNIWYGGDIRKPHTKDWHLIRKSGDAVFYILKQLMLMKRLDISIDTGWEKGNEQVCEAFVKLWNTNHQLGQFINSQTGEIAVGGSTSGAIVPGAMALASVYYHKPQYLVMAEEAAAYYANQYVSKGIACGGPGDALQNFDSESSYAMLESYMTLFEVTHNSKWLELAKNAANQFATWVVAYNYQFPETSDFYKLGIHTKGAVYANTQNKCATPGICTYSGLALMKLYNYTGDDFYLHLLRDIAHGITQYLPYDGRKIGNTPTGVVSERINMSDWEGEERIGGVFPMSTWAETSLMLTTVEVPGIYINFKYNTYEVFDNVSVKCLRKNNRAVTLAITNTYDRGITVSTFVEKQGGIQENRNLFYPQYDHLYLKAGETKMITFRK